MLFYFEGYYKAFSLALPLRPQLQSPLVIANYGNFIIFCPESTVAIRKLRPEFKFPTKIEMAFSQILAIK